MEGKRCYLQCDYCPAQSPRSDSSDRLVRDMRLMGWHIGVTDHCCPMCPPPIVDGMAPVKPSAPAAAELNWSE